jgi:hypothetical protein
MWTHLYRDSFTFFLKILAVTVWTDFSLINTTRPDVPLLTLDVFWRYVLLAVKQYATNVLKESTVCICMYAYIIESNLIPDASCKFFPDE